MEAELAAFLDAADEAAGRGLQPQGLSGEAFFVKLHIQRVAARRQQRLGVSDIPDVVQMAVVVDLVGRNAPFGGRSQYLRLLRAARQLTPPTLE